MRRLVIIKWYKIRMNYLKLLLCSSLDEEMKGKLLDKIDECSKKINELSMDE